MAIADADYTVFAALAQYGQGVVPTRETIDGLQAALTANGGQTLSQAQVLAVTGALPSYPASLPRFPDSNPEPRSA